MISEAKRVEIKGYVWNEGQAPAELAWDGPDDFDKIQLALTAQLETIEFGKIVRTYPNMKPGDEELALYYRAFTHEYRGRQIVSGADEADLNRHYMQHKQYCDMRVFSPAELYAFKPVRVEYDVNTIVRIHVPEIDTYGLDHEAVEATKRIEYRELAYHSPDSYRTWELGSIWLDGKPIMVVNNSGRGGDEYSERWITDAALYSEMIVFLRQFIAHSEVTGFVKADTKIPAMTEFYGNTIHDYYDVDTQEAKK
jgi:hypothetical protein